MFWHLTAVAVDIFQALALAPLFYIWGAVRVRRQTDREMARVVGLWRAENQRLVDALHQRDRIA